MKWIIIFLLTIIISVNSAKAGDGQPGSRFSRVIQVIFENTDYAAALKQADFANLIQKGALLTQLSAQNHPSQGNYIAMVAGSTLGVATDRNVNLSDRHIGNLLEEAGLSWKVYAEGYPGNCFTGASKGQYVRKHNPLISFIDVANNPERCRKVVNSSEFDADVRENSVPAFSLYIPDLRNDGHDTGVDFAGKYLTKKFVPLLNNKSFMMDTLFIFTFDENRGKSGNQVYTVLVGPSVKPGSVFSAPIGHPALTRLVEDEFRLGSLHKMDESSLQIEGIWQ